MYNFRIRGNPYLGMNTIISLAYIKHICHILAELFNKCLQESCFPDCWKVSSVVSVFKNVGERYTTKNYGPVSLPSVVSKVFEKL